ncbi:hypothetical protein B296_00000648 [Ensete ventricosum]|uniref:Uncharacterized protein n=1 Tax=Ensete ventricosum TaxID=4639 RepID=A0A427AW10_ENSVE|nr:hypothetical protein B296_00000648 [Ensete ventricosum]
MYIPVLASFLLKLLGSHARRLESPHPQLDPRSLDSQSATDKAKKEPILDQKPHKNRKKQKEKENGRPRSKEEARAEAKGGEGREGERGRWGARAGGGERGEEAVDEEAAEMERRSRPQKRHRWSRSLQLLDAMFPPLTPRLFGLRSFGFASSAVGVKQRDKTLNYGDGLFLEAQTPNRILRAQTRTITQFAEMILSTVSSLNNKQYDSDREHIVANEKAQKTNYNWRCRESNGGVALPYELHPRC